MNRRIAAAALTASLLATGVAAAAPAQGTTTTLGTRALRVAAAQNGDPYAWGAAGPNRFDCSGLVYYSFRQAGRTVKRTASDQYRYSTYRISAQSRRPGDLVFFLSGGRAYHVAIYAGSGMIWDAPHSGSYVHKRKLWTSAVSYGRVRS